MRKRFDAHVHIIPPEMLYATDKRFSITREPFGRVRTASGYELQLLVPCFENSAFSAGALLKTMDYYQVEKAVIMQSLCFSMNESVAAAVQAAPERLNGAMVIEPVAGWQDAMRYWREQGLRAIKFEMSAAMGFSSPKAYPQLRFNDPLMMELFELAQQLELTVTVDPSSIGGRGYQPEALYEAARRFSGLHLVICHLGYPEAGMQPGSEKDARWRQMLELARLPNVWFDVSALPALFKPQEYPYTEAVQAVTAFVKQYGGSKAVWGTDIPGTWMEATYPQMIQMFERCGALDEEEKESLFWRNARDAYRL